MVLYGLVWSCMVLYGLVWSCVVLCGFVWSCVVLCGLVWSCMVLCGLVLSCVVLCGLVWSCMVLYGLVWSCMILYGLVWSCTALYGVCALLLSSTTINADVWSYLYVLCSMSRVSIFVSHAIGKGPYTNVYQAPDIVNPAQLSAFVCHRFVIDDMKLEGNWAVLDGMGGNSCRMVE